jgi:hypothetical protein
MKELARAFGVAVASVAGMWLAAQIAQRVADAYADDLELLMREGISELRRRHWIDEQARRDTGAVIWEAMQILEEGAQ